MAGRVRFGLIGAGGIAQAHLQAFMGSDIAELCAVADPRQEAAAALAESGRCRAYACHKAMAEAEQLDAVLVATPPSTHPEISLYFVSRGIHVLCEKPLSTGIPEARWMVDAAASAGVLLTMGSKFRYSEDVVQARALIASGVIGSPIRLENVFTSKVDMASRWNSRREIGGGGVLIDNGTHSADIMRFLAGPIRRVFATEAQRLQPMEVEDTVHVACTSESGVLGTFDLSWSVNCFAPDYLRVWGSDGTLCVGWAESRYRKAGGGDWVVFGKGYNKVQGLKAQLDNFSSAILGREPLRIASEDVLASVHVVDACYRSLESGAWVDVEAEARGGRQRKASAEKRDLRA